MLQAIASQPKDYKPAGQGEIIIQRPLLDIDALLGANQNPTSSIGKNLEDFLARLKSGIALGEAKKRECLSRCASEKPDDKGCKTACDYSIELLVREGGTPQTSQVPAAPPAVAAEPEPQEKPPAPVAPPGPAEVPRKRKKTCTDRTDHLRMITLGVPGVHMKATIRCRKGDRVRQPLRLPSDKEAGPVLMLQNTEPYRVGAITVDDKLRWPDGMLGFAYTVRLDLDDPRTFDPDDMFVNLFPSTNDQTFWFTTLSAFE